MQGNEFHYRYRVACHPATFNTKMSAMLEGGLSIIGNSDINLTGQVDIISIGILKKLNGRMVGAVDHGLEFIRGG